LAWIKFEKDLLTDPRVLRMAKRLQEKFLLADVATWASTTETCNGQALPSVTLVCGCLVRIWSLADTHVDGNDVLPLGFDDIDKLLGVPGFCSLMPVEWIEQIDTDSVKLPNYHEHNGTEAKRKAVTQKRVAAFRSRNAQALPDQDQTKTRKDHKKNTVGKNPDVHRQAREVLNFLNDKTGRNYEPVPANLEMVEARLKEGASVDDLRAVVAKKTREWASDEKMAQYLRPATLFNRTKFAQYKGELGVQEPA
jgi:uncharacterized phage protein (TIGR02220 family)